MLADRVLSEENHGPFGEKNFFIPNGHWPYGPSRAMRRCARGLDLGQDLGGLVELADLTAPVRYGPGVAPVAGSGQTARQPSMAV